MGEDGLEEDKEEEEEEEEEEKIEPFEEKFEVENVLDAVNWDRMLGIRVGRKILRS